MTSDFAGTFEKGLAGLNLTVQPEVVDRLTLYFGELLKWSRKVNLIARETKPLQIIENHFLDSLTLLPLLAGGDSHLLDVGTGAGFPGLVCKVARPELAVTLVEPRSKRVSFLGHIVRTLGLEGVSLLNCRVEDEVRLASTRTFSHVTSRAVTEIGPFIHMVARFAATGPRVICMKGPRWPEELAAASDIIDHSPYRLDEVVEHVLPFSGARRSLLVFVTR